MRYQPSLHYAACAGGTPTGLCCWQDRFPYLIGCAAKAWSTPCSRSLAWMIRRPVAALATTSR
jgi:hypothetical protein